MRAVKVENYSHFRAKLLQWAATLEHCAFLEDALSQTIRVGVSNDNKTTDIEHLPQGEWQFGYISYDYKNKLEDLVSEHSETISFDNSHFFSPQIVATLTPKAFTLEFGTVSLAELVETVLQSTTEQTTTSPCKILPKLSKEEYISRVESLQNHIQRGDIYEVNFCQEFTATDAKLSPTEVYNRLLTASPMPFAAFLKQGKKYAFCSSPERYVQKIGDTIISQPIKGTAKRGKTTEEDNAIIEALKNNPKERAENVMAVDVVRNDLARVAIRGSVEVDELCEVYTFQQLHQMISTVSAKLDKTTTFHDVVKASFPMASMTGAPKIRAMQLIEQYENSKRGLYSGTIGYLTPNGDYDFNVVIRSILYDNTTHQLSFTVGSAITAEATASQEYAECLLKAEAMMKILK